MPFLKLHGIYKYLEGVALNGKVGWKFAKAAGIGKWEILRK